MTRKGLPELGSRRRGSPFEAQSDERLVELVRGGSEPAFEEIVRRYRRPLLCYCQRLAPGRSPEDTVQQVLISAFVAMRRDHGELRLRPWLFRIAHNAALDALRERGWDHEALSPHHDGVERPEEAAERREQLCRLLALVAALPERQRAAIVLRALEGRSYSEISEQLEVSRGGVRQLLHRARESLRTAAGAMTPPPLLLKATGLAGRQGPRSRVMELVGADGAGLGMAKASALIAVTAVVGGATHGPLLDAARKGSASGAVRAAIAHSAPPGGTPEAEKPWTAARRDGRLTTSAGTHRQAATLPNAPPSGAVPQLGESDPPRVSAPSEPPPGIGDQQAGDDVEHPPGPPTGSADGTQPAAVAQAAIAPDEPSDTGDGDYRKHDRLPDGDDGTGESEDEEDPDDGAGEPEDDEEDPDDGDLGRAAATPPGFAELIDRASPDPNGTAPFEADDPDAELD